MQSYIAVLDFEATCANKDAPGAFDISQQEIIELPVALIDTREKKVIASFGTFVKPLAQPQLTPFCTQLTSIRQVDVDNAPDVHQAMGELRAFFDAHGATKDNTLVVTCGDWDLKTCWPVQVSVAKVLETPTLFKRWCNLKAPYTKVTRQKGGGMMGMLETLGIKHQGVHHRGADDVRNICQIVIELIKRGANIQPSWSDEQRVVEYQHRHKRWSESQATLRANEHTLKNLPANKQDVRAQLEGTVARIRDEVARLAAQRDVFS